MTKNEILSSDIVVRRNVARNPNTPVDVLTELAKDSDWAVRRNAAINPKYARRCTHRTRIELILNVSFKL